MRHALSQTWKIGIGSQSRLTKVALALPIFTLKKVTLALLAALQFTGSG